MRGKLNFQEQRRFAGRRARDQQAQIEIFDDSVERHGWSGQTYDAYRVQVPYPMMHGLVRLVVRPSRPGGAK